MSNVAMSVLSALLNNESYIRVPDLMTTRFTIGYHLCGFFRLQLHNIYIYIYITYTR